MTDDATMRRLAEGATGGSEWFVPDDSPREVLAYFEDDGDPDPLQVAAELRPDDAAFIAAAREKVPELLDRVADAEAEAVAASVAHHEAEAENERLTILAKQAEDLDTRNQRLTGDWRAALREAERYHGRWSDAMKSAEDLRADYEQVRQMNANQVETIAALRAEIDDLRETLDDLSAALDEEGGQG